MQVDLDFFIENVFHPYLDELIDDGDNSNDDDDDDDDHDDNDTDVEEINKTNKNIKSQNINDYLDSFFIKVQH